MRGIAILVGVTLLYLVVFDLVGVVACFLLDIASVLPLRMGNVTTLLSYTLWLVLGVFCGLLSYDAGGTAGSPNGPGDWTSREDAVQTGRLVVGIEIAVVAALWLVCRRFLWGSDWGDGIYVPDNAGLTLAFFAAFVASVVLGHTLLRPAPVR